MAKEIADDAIVAVKVAADPELNPFGFTPGTLLVAKRLGLSVEKANELLDAVLEAMNDIVLAKRHLKVDKDSPR